MDDGTPPLIVRGVLLEDILGCDGFGVALRLAPQTHDVIEPYGVWCEHVVGVYDTNTMPL